MKKIVQFFAFIHDFQKYDNDIRGHINALQQRIQRLEDLLVSSSDAKESQDEIQREVSHLKKNKIAFQDIFKRTT